MTPIRDWPQEDQPGYKMLRGNSTLMSVSEVLAVLITTGTREHNALELGMRIYDHFHHNMYDLAKATVEDLMKIKGIGAAKAAAIVAALELGKRLKNTPPPDRHYLKSSRDANEFVRPFIFEYERPTYGVLYLTQAGWVKDAGILQLTAPPAFFPNRQGILRGALERDAVSFVTFETANDLQPRQQRIEDIQKLQKVAQLLDLKLLDHMIVTRQRYVSFADEGQI